MKVSAKVSATMRSTEGNVLPWADSFYFFVRVSAAEVGALALALARSSGARVHEAEPHIVPPRTNQGRTAIDPHQYQRAVKHAKA